MRRAVNFEFILVVGEAQDHMRKRLIAELRGCFGAEHPRTVATYPRKLVVFKPETFKQMAAMCIRIFYPRAWTRCS